MSPDLDAVFRGRLLGAAVGASAIPARWLGTVELRGVVIQVAGGLAASHLSRIDLQAWETADPDQ